MKCTRVGSLSFLFIALSIFLVSVSQLCSAEDVQTYSFQTEVNRVMEIIINSLYKTKEIFLRELISNASDAVNKLRLLALSDDDLRNAVGDLNITIRADKEKKQLFIRDTGIGMTADELRSNLGTIAKSGTKDFMKNLSAQMKEDPQQIGQFGVGFYSVFLVADRVQVMSKSHNERQHIWSCNISSNQFSVYPDPEGDTLGDHGTQIVIDLKEDVDDNNYLEEGTLRQLIKRYSEFINFPIYLYTTRSRQEDIPEEELLAAKEAKAAEKKEDDAIKVEDEDQEEEAKEADIPKTRTIYYGEYELINDMKPLWTRDPKDVETDEYNKFYSSWTKDKNEPKTYIHFKAEGGAHSSDFKALLYIPANPSFSAFSKDEPEKFLSLFVKRVFITDDFRENFPRYLSFIKGIVDAEEMDLNVSRELLQKTRSLTAIKNRVVSKTLEMIRNLAASNESQYASFYEKYAGHLKLGLMSDEENKNKLSKLLRYYSSFNDSKLTSFDDYISRMKPNQTEIYFVTGTSIKAMKAFPYVEKILSKGYEVLYMDDPFDSYAIQPLRDYEGKTLRDVAKAGLKLPDDTDEEKKEREDAQEKFKPLSELLVSNLKAKIDRVVISSVLEKSPVAIVASEYGWSPAMEKLMKGNKNDPMSMIYGRQKKVMEINPRHPLIIGLLDKALAASKEDVEAQESLQFSAKLLYETALLHSGYELPDPAAFAHRVETLMREKLGLEKPAPESAPEEVEEPEAFDYSAFMKNAGAGGAAGGDGFGGAGDMPDFGDINMEDMERQLNSEDPLGVNHEQNSHDEL